MVDLINNAKHTVKMDSTVYIMNSMEVAIRVLGFSKSESVSQFSDLQMMLLEAHEGAPDMQKIITQLLSVVIYTSNSPTQYCWWHIVALLCDEAFCKYLKCPSHWSHWWQCTMHRLRATTLSSSTYSMLIYKALPSPVTSTNRLLQHFQI